MATGASENALIHQQVHINCPLLSCFHHIFSFPQFSFVSSIQHFSCKFKLSFISRHHFPCDCGLWDTGSGATIVSRFNIWLWGLFESLEEYRLPSNIDVSLKTVVLTWSIDVSRGDHGDVSNIYSSARLVNGVLGICAVFTPFLCQRFVTLSHCPQVQLVVQRQSESAVCVCPDGTIEYPWVSLDRGEWGETTREVEWAETPAVMWWSNE